MTATATTLIPTTHDALLRAVLLAPHDDQPRLIYADWCDENGREERAEFIRVQIILANNRDNRVGLDWVEEFRLWKRESELFRRVSEIGVVEEFDHYSRGFVREIHVTHDYFLEHAAAIFAAHPVERVVLTDILPMRVPLDGLALSDLGPVNTWYYRRWRIGPKFAHNLNWQIFDKLPSPRLHSQCAFYATREGAVDAIFAACVALGRERAGLTA